jgi:uncharacterized protein (DUF2141 family)
MPTCRVGFISILKSDAGFRQAIGLLIAVFAILAVGAAKAADLTVVVNALRSATGTVHVALYRTPESFPKSGAMLEDKVVPADLAGSRATFGNLTPGRYAIAVYHDENANNDFDQGIFGIPLEGYAFSNGATVFFGPPAFDEAAINVDKDTTTIVIPMGY